MKMVMFGEDIQHKRESNHNHHSLSGIHSDSDDVTLYRRLMPGLVTTTTSTTNLRGKKSGSGDQAVIKELLNDAF